MLHGIAHGPSPSDHHRARGISAYAFIYEQLNPTAIRETDPRLMEELDDLFLEVIPDSGEFLPS